MFLEKYQTSRASRNEPCGDVVAGSIIFSQRAGNTLAFATGWPFLIHNDASNSTFGAFVKPVLSEILACGLAEIGRAAPISMQIDASPSASKAAGHGLTAVTAFLPGSRIPEMRSRSVQRADQRKPHALRLRGKEALR